jgi:hypothetical protein
LKPRTFRIGTWNTQGSSGRNTYNKSFLKVPLAEDIMFVEKLDILILTKTHTDRFTCSNNSLTLAQTGSSTASAGIAILAPNNGSWSASETHKLIPGHAIISKLSHSISRESFWLLAIYRDISSSPGLTSIQTLRNFYSSLSLELVKTILHIQTSEIWTGCVAAGDWNLTKHNDDRDPPKPADKMTLKHFTNIKTLCLMTDAARPGPLPSLWSCRKKNAHGTSSSRIDRIYRPLIGWNSSNPTSIPTNWSDHNLVHCTLTVCSPAVQTAKPAPRMPDPKYLNRKFWNKSLDLYKKLTENPIALEPWVAMKKELLRLSIASSQKI